MFPRPPPDSLPVVLGQFGLLGVEPLLPLLWLLPPEPCPLPPALWPLPPALPLLLLLPEPPPDELPLLMFLRILTREYVVGARSRSRSHAIVP